MEHELMCNNKKCRSKLVSLVWITSCSHIFCDKCGSREFGQSYKPTCPACETVLQEKFDLFRVDIDLTEPQKSMMLAGQRPEAIMDICSRALTFWTYQECQERTYQEFLVSRSKEKSAQIQQYYEEIIGKLQSELNVARNQLDTTKTELEKSAKRYRSTLEKMQENNRQHKKLQGMYDALRRKNMTPVSRLKASSPEERGGGPPIASHSSMFQTGQGDFVLKPTEVTESPFHMEGRGTNLVSPLLGDFTLDLGTFKESRNKTQRKK